MIELEVNDANFKKWTKSVQDNVRKMMPESLFEAGLLIDQTTERFVPIDWAYLIRSYEGHIFTPYPKIELEISYTGRHSPRFKGYDYAWIQHEEPFFHPQGGTDHYLEKGIMRSVGKVFSIVTKDYLSCFGIRL